MLNNIQHSAIGLNCHVDGVDEKVILNLNGPGLRREFLLNSHETQREIALKIVTELVPKSKGMTTVGQDTFNTSLPIWAGAHIKNVFKRKARSLIKITVTRS